MYIEDTRGGEGMRVSYLTSLPGCAIYAYDAQDSLEYVRAGSPASWVGFNAAPIMIVLISKFKKMMKSVEWMHTNETLLDRET